MSYGKIVDEKLSEKRVERESEELKKFFKPSICIQSKQLLEKKESSNLFDITQERSAKIKTDDETFTFKPSISEYDPSMFKGVTKPKKQKKSL